MSTKKKKVKSTPWVVYQQKIGRTPAGMYQREVIIKDELAFVMPNGSSKQVDMISSKCVFATKNLAEAFITGDGIRTWCVSQCWNKPAEMFEGLVKHFYVDFFGRKASRIAAKRISDGVVFNDVYRFDTKKQAFTAYREHNTELRKQLLRNKKENDEKFARLNAVTK